MRPLSFRRSALKQKPIARFFWKDEEKDTRGRAKKRIYYIVCYNFCQIITQLAEDVPSRAMSFHLGGRSLSYLCKRGRPWRKMKDFQVGSRVRRHKRAMRREININHLNWGDTKPKASTAVEAPQKGIMESDGRRRVGVSRRPIGWSSLEMKGKKEGNK